MGPTGEVVVETFDHDGGRRVTVHVPPGPVASLVVAADGGWHVHQLSQRLESVGARSTMIVGVDGRNDDDGRLREYVPGFDARRFAAHQSFVVDDVGRWVAERFGVRLPASRTAVWGASLGAEFALATGLSRSDVFGVVLAASPGAGFTPPEVFPSELPRVYLVAGRQEPFFLDNSLRWTEALRGAGADVVMEQRDGEHGGGFWTNEFPSMVEWAFDP